MRTFFTVFCGVTLAACSAVALEKEFVDQIMQSAQNIERDASLVSQALKTKRVDTGDVTTKLDAMDVDVTKLQQLVKDFDATNPQLSERDQAGWKLLKDKVQLLDIFHEQKRTLAAGDMGKNRDLIRAIANGVVMRAQKLQKTAMTLRRG